ncbi:hypothetical protein DPMN_064790 [Dreissena polymorpha]|uniref:Uncharacterized protein n=1 Tax=Dreissena polymorpha TaxID=45954 RepID=A0A9D4CCV5_DREPO|nr:hypothetical protein DPMN_064790 [Dreissena polymorpha]
MDKEDVKLRHRQLCPVCPFVFDWVMNTEEEVKLSQRRFSRACPFDNESFGRSRDIDDMIEDQFLQSYERFLEEKYKEEFDNCFADEIGGVDDEEQNKIEHLPYVQSPYNYLIDKKLDEEAHHIYFSDYEAFAQYIETRDEEADHIYFSDDDASDAAFE